MGDISTEATPAEVEGAAEEITMEGVTETDERESLFGETVFDPSSDVDNGDSPSKDDKADEPGDGEGAEPEEKKEGAEEGDPAKEEGEKPDEKPEEKKDEPAEGKPPKGYVPTKALHEARAEKQALKAELDLLKQQATRPAQTQVPNGFKVLEKEAYEELKNEDPVAAVEYLNNLRDYDREQDRIRTVQDGRNHAISSAVERIAKNVPGVYDNDSDVSQKLMDHAMENGFDGDSLTALSDPRTMIWPSGAPAPIPLGEGAAAIVEMINSSYAGTDNSELVEKLTAEITEKLTKEFTSKTNTQSDSKRTLGDLPASKETQTQSTWHALNEDQMRNLSPDARDKYRQGLPFD